MAKWDTSVRSCAVVGSHEKRTNRRNDVDMMRGHHKGKSFLSINRPRVSRFPKMKLC